MKPEEHEDRFYLNSVPGLEAALYLHITWYHNCSSEQVDQDEVGDSEAQIFNFFHLSILLKDIFLTIVQQQFLIPKELRVLE